jgi:hypothetical protein
MVMGVNETTLSGKLFHVVVILLGRNYFLKSCALRLQADYSEHGEKPPLP